MLATMVLICLTAISLGKSTSLGLSNELSDGRIVGGESANIEDFPYQLSLQRMGRHYCGACIISSNWAITAAHCVTDVQMNLMTLRAGSSLRRTGGSVHQVVKMIPHRQYRNSDYDIALLKVKTPFKFGPGVAVVNLPDMDEDVPTGTKTNVTGWGHIEEFGPVSSQLQMVEVPVISRARCQAAYRLMTITPRMVCAGYHEGGKDACQGDSGGPMVSGGKLVGTVSWGLGCARPTYPGVYARVASVRSWIKKFTGV